MPFDNVRTQIKCRSKRGAGDLQVETVLSPLFLRQRKGAGFPKTSILDYGCGEGDLLKALRTFPPQILSQIRYVGLDPDPVAIEAARAIAEEADTTVPRTTPLARTMAECRVGLLSDLSGLRNKSFDIVHVVNVLHHVDLDVAVDKFFTNTMYLLKVGGYLVIEDFFLGTPTLPDGS